MYTKEMLKKPVSNFSLKSLRVEGRCIERGMELLALVRKTTSRRVALLAPSHLTRDDQPCSSRMKNEHELCMCSWEL